MRPEDVFESIYELMKFGSNISSISESDGISTITTDEIYSLENGMMILINNRTYQISNISIISLNVYTFDIEATGLIADKWELALFFETGKAIEINTSLKTKKNDPLNKNKRFPLMWLFSDITKDYNFEIGYKADITIAFVYLSEVNLRTLKRIELNYVPILDPLVKLFKKNIITSPGKRNFIFKNGENLNISETDKFKYGSVNGKGNVFDDIADAIELNMSLHFNYTQICN